MSSMLRAVSNLKQNPWIVKAYPAYHLFKVFYRQLEFRITRRDSYPQRFYCAELLNSLAGYQPKSDISDHLSTIFYHAMEVKPHLIVELGTGTGESSRALLAAAVLNNGRVLSIDIHDCQEIELLYRKYWDFINCDDIEFGENRFVPWCERQEIEPRADVIFIDTSHLYEHTKKEIRVWSKHLADDGVIIFHDTNMGKGVYSLLDGSVRVGWDNDRGVIRAIEEFLGKDYGENQFFVDVSANFLIRHYPYSNGMTILRRLGRLQ